MARYTKRELSSHEKKCDVKLDSTYHGSSSCDLVGSSDVDNSLNVILPGSSPICSVWAQLTCYLRRCPMSNTPCGGLGIDVLEGEETNKRLVALNVNSATRNKETDRSFDIPESTLQPKKKREKGHLDEVRSIYRLPLLRHKEVVTRGSLRSQQPQVLGWSNPYAYKHWQH